MKKHLIQGLIATACSVLPLTAVAQYSMPMNGSAGATTDMSLQNSTDMSLDIMKMLSAETAPMFFEHKIIRTFENVGAEKSAHGQSSYDNTSLNDSAFDFRQYVRHRCFTIVNEYDRAWCTAEFGPYADLRATLFDGTLLKILTNFGILHASEHALVNGVGFDVQINEQNDIRQQNAFSTTRLDTELSTNSNLLSRGRALWQLCGERDMDRQAACYQDNQRLLTDTTLELEGNLYYEARR